MACATPPVHAVYTRPHPFQPSRAAVVKRLTLVTRPMSVFPETLPEGESAAAPAVQDGSARESHPGTANGSAFKPPSRNSPPGQPGSDGDHPAVLRCKRRSQLPQDRAPVRPYVLHALPRGYAEGDLDAVANGTNPPAGDALRAGVGPAPRPQAGGRSARTSTPPATSWALALLGGLPGPWDLTA